MEPTEHRVNANGIDFAYLACGDEGPLAMCLHGFPDSPFTYRHLLPELASAGYRAVVRFTRGFAPTEVPPERRHVHTSTMVADTVGLHEALGGTATRCSSPTTGGQWPLGARPQWHPAAGGGWSS